MCLAKQGEAMSNPTDRALEFLAKAPTPAQQQVTFALINGRLPQGWTLLEWFAWAIQDVMNTPHSDGRVLLDGDCQVIQHRSQTMAIIANGDNHQMLVVEIGKGLRQAGWKLQKDSIHPRNTSYWILPL